MSIHIRKCSCGCLAAKGYIWPLFRLVLSPWSRSRRLSLVCLGTHGRRGVACHVTIRLVAASRKCHFRPVFSVRTCQPRSKLHIDPPKHRSYLKPLTPKSRVLVNELGSVAPPADPWPQIYGCTTSIFRWRSTCTMGCGSTSAQMYPKSK